MGIFRKKEAPEKRSIRFVGNWDWDEVIACGYVPLSHNPDVRTAVHEIAKQIASMTIYLMANTESGDRRIINELSKKIDINPCQGMTRITWMTGIVQTLLLWGRGNAIVYPHTERGLLGDLEPIAWDRVEFRTTKGSTAYQVVIDGKAYDPEDLLHFVWNPDEIYPWKGQGYTVSLADVTKNLVQASTTKRAFLQSKWKPSVIVKVDASVEEFSSPEGRHKLLDEYITSQKAGEPWLIPGEQFEVTSVKPLTLQDLAIHESVVLDKKTVAGILGVPAWILGAGDFNADEWNAFVNNTIRPIAQEIEQELTRKLIIKNEWYVRFNMMKLYSYDLEKIANVYGNLYDKGSVTKNELRDKVGMDPVDGGDMFVVLENYIPADMIGQQSKLQGGN